MTQTTDMRHQTADLGLFPTLEDSTGIAPPGCMSHVSCLMSRPKGFTLVEVMIVAVLFLIISGALLTMFLTGRTSYLSSDAYVLVQQEARRGFDVMVRELREAQITTGPPVACNQANWSNQLNFQVALSYDSVNGNIDWGADGVEGQWAHYAVVPGPANIQQLVRCVNNDAGGAIVSGAGCRVLANYVRPPVGGVNGATFCYDSGERVVGLRLQIQYANPALPTGSHSTPLMTSRVKLRNS